MSRKVLLVSRKGLSGPRKVLMGAAAAAALSLVQIPSVFAAEMETLTEKVSYVIGYNIGQNFVRDNLDIDPDTLIRAIKDATSGKESALSEEEMQTAMLALRDQMQAKQMAVFNEMSEANLKQGGAFLQANAQKEGVVTTESGLQYKVLNKGSGEKPAADNRVTVHYSGKLLDGTEFDSSYSRGEPATFGVTQVIPGWTEVLQLMPEGSKWEVYVPAELAYGPGGAGGEIGPNATLVFEIELLDANVE